VVQRYLVVNADDFGRSPGINLGVIQAYEQGILTSASLMVRWPAAKAAAEYARECPQLGVGLHLDFGEWTYRDRAWLRLYQVVDETDSQAVSGEITRQLEAFESLTGRLPVHVDSHQHRHRSEPAHSILIGLARQFDIPLRDSTPSVRYSGRFYGQNDQGASYPECISVEGLVEILSGLGPGATEIGCHPAAVADLDTMYGMERLIELSTLCDPRVRRAIDDLGIKLKSFADWRSFAEPRG
jgi:chitin disaccharide deacetylase